MKKIDETLADLKLRYGISLVEKQGENLAFVKSNKEMAVSLITHLRDIEGFSHLSFLTAVDYLEDNFFRLTYILHNYKLKADMGIFVDLPRDEAVMDSIAHLWEQAPTYQRELKEMFGIDFPGSPGVDEPFILESWGDNPPPMRRDFDTKKYSEETYFPRPGRSTVDPREHMKKKLYPEDESV